MGVYPVRSSDKLQIIFIALGGTLLLLVLFAPRFAPPAERDPNWELMRMSTNRLTALYSYLRSELASADTSDIDGGAGESVVLNAARRICERTGPLVFKVRAKAGSGTPTDWVWGCVNPTWASWRNPAISSGEVAIYWPVAWHVNSNSPPVYMGITFSQNIVLFSERPAWKPLLTSLLKKGPGP